MLPRIEYKLHPRFMQIQQEKQWRRDELVSAYNKQAQQLSRLKVERHEYINENKKVIGEKKEQIYQKNLERTNRVKAEEQKRYERIQEKRLERLERLVPERQHLIEQLRRNYQEQMEHRQNRRHDIERDFESEKQLLLEQLMKPQKVQQEFVSTNEGICVICLTEKAELLMRKCRHLVSCRSCEFIMRMQLKCPLCREPGKYISIYSKKE